MRLGDVQNLYGKTLDAQAVFQQAVAASDLATRQTAKALEVERERDQARVSSAQETASGEASATEQESASVQEPVLKGYRLAYRPEQGMVLEEELFRAPKRRPRLDRNA